MPSEVLQNLAGKATHKAIRTAEAVEFVPFPNGGVQLQLYASGARVEVDIRPEGTIVGGLIEIGDYGGLTER